jgi:hypothetical protein
VEDFRGAAFGLLLLGVASAAITGSLLPPPAAHWSDHILTAAVAGGQLVALAAGAWLARRALSRTSLVILSLIAVGLMFELVGNVIAGRSIWRQPFGDEDVWEAAHNFPGFELGHDLAEYGDVGVLLGGLVLATVLGVERRVHWAVAVIAGVLVLIPPWLLPALSTVFLLAWLIARPRHRIRRLRAEAVPRSKAR